MTAIRATLVALSLSVLAACNTAPPQQSFPDVTYKHLPPIRLDVKSVEIASAYSPPLKAPHVEHLFPLPPGVAAERWARDRLQAVGKEGRARFVVREAGVLEERLAKSGGITGLVTTEQTARYVAELAVELVVHDDLGQREGNVKARAQMSRTVPEDLTLNGLEQAWFEMTEALMRDLNAQLESGVAAYLKPFLK
jgi:hypothetical protein